MIKSKILPVFKNIFFCSVLLLTISCADDEPLNDVLEVADNATVSAKSSSSVELPISDSSVSADTAHGSYPVSNTVDGNTAHTSRWAGWGRDVNFDIDLDSESFIDYLNIAFAGSGRVYEFDIYTSNDKSSWVKVGSKSSLGTTSYEEFDITNSTARYIRINFQGSDANAWNNVKEIQVYGTLGETTNTTTITTEVSTGIVDFGDLEVETSWITEETGNRTTFDAADVDGEEWMDVYNSGIVMMKCLAPDSHRTELKEKSNVESSLSTYKKMSYTATLTSIPSHGVTIAQIHNRGGVQRPWIRVYVDADRYIRIKSTLTTPWQTSSEGGSEYDVWEGPKYTSGEEFSVVITTGNGEASFEITAGGETEGVILSPEEDWDDYNSDYYLKAGVYTEGDDLQPQIKFSSFGIDY